MRHVAVVSAGIGTTLDPAPYPNSDRLIEAATPIRSPSRRALPSGRAGRIRTSCGSTMPVQPVDRITSCALPLRVPVGSGQNSASPPGRRRRIRGITASSVTTAPWRDAGLRTRRPGRAQLVSKKNQSPVFCGSTNSSKVRRDLLLISYLRRDWPCSRRLAKLNLLAVLFPLRFLDSLECGGIRLDVAVESACAIVFVVPFELLLGHLPLAGAGAFLPFLVPRALSAWRSFRNRPARGYCIR